MSDMNDFNTKVIAEFRANSGVVGGHFEGMPMVLVTNKGAKSGVERTTPLCCTVDDGNIVIIASMGGAPTNPAWYHNMTTHPTVTVEFGTETYAARVEEVSGDERQRLYNQQAAVMPFFTEYQAKTTRTIPVLVLHRIVD